MYTSLYLVFDPLNMRSNHSDPQGLRVPWCREKRGKRAEESPRVLGHVIKCHVIKVELSSETGIFRSI